VYEDPFSRDVAEDVTVPEVTPMIRPLLRRLPAPLRSRIRGQLQRFPSITRLLTPASEREQPPGTVVWGSLRRTRPFSRNWGYDRGTPIDRTYIEMFLQAHVADIKGHGLEVMTPAYLDRFGGERVVRRDVLDIDAANTRATVVADLNEPDSLPAARFDCIVFTQTLHLVPDMRVALANIWRALSPGGVLLLTVPALGRHDARQGFHHDRWRVTRTGLEWLLTTLEGSRWETMVYGNLLSCTAFLYGLATEELSAEEVHVSDPEFPLIVAARVVKEGAP
jgi:SAM-dependent methyltransferase